MKFVETKLKGAFVIELDMHSDDRGFFARSFCKHEFAQFGLNNSIIQINNSLSKYKGTLRGMHYQLFPKQEDKIVRCIKGAIYDVIIDMRKESETFSEWFGIELSEANRKSLYVPKGFAHGNISLVDNSELFYLTTEYYSPDFERGIRWDDPKFNIKWPIVPVEISEKDSAHPLYNPEYHFK
jgi:dTDP-4-dehydrorhamnose 3,5-epimerase